jgi:hypothetical protein
LTALLALFDLTERSVSSPRTDRSELAGADVIVDDMDGVVRALLNPGN